MKYELAARCSGIHVFLQALEADIFIAQVCNGGNEVFESAAEPVQALDY